MIFLIKAQKNNLRIIEKEDKKWDQVLQTTY